MAKKTAKATKKGAAEKSAKVVSRKKRPAGRSGSGDGALSIAKPGPPKSESAGKGPAKKKATSCKTVPAKSKAKKKSGGESASRKTGAGPGRGLSKPSKAPSRAAGAKKPEPPARAEDYEAEVPQPIRKTRLKPEELSMFQDMLIAKRNQLLGTVQQLRDDALHKSRQESAGDLSSMPIHMADIGSDNWEQEFTLDLLANENDLLHEIDQALERIDKGIYGICLGTNKPIQKRRLRAKPWAKYCIEYARELELRGRP